MTGTHQQWDIATSVGLTALAVAAARAIETRTEGGLVEDPLAAAFVHAAHPPRPLPTSPGEGDELWTAMAAYIGLRSRFFDEVVTGTDAPQVVILAAGLDARAYRLDLTGRDVYEVDQPRVLEFKQQVLDEEGAEPRCRRHTIAADLRDDWPAALERAGFDRTRPAVWLAEGLLMYLPARAEEELFELVHARSAPGSRIGVEQVPGGGVRGTDRKIRTMSTPERLGVDLNDLLSTEPRRDPATWLAGEGWQVSTERSGALAIRYGRPLPAELNETVTGAELIRADLPGTTGG
jgi:methyltransferase (TIGR00027 family)